MHDIALSLARCIRPGGMIHLTETTLPPDEVMFNPTGWNAFVIPVIVIVGLAAIVGALINRRRKRVDMLEALKSVD